MKGFWIGGLVGGAFVGALWYGAWQHSPATIAAQALVHTPSTWVTYAQCEQYVRDAESANGGLIPDMAFMLQMKNPNPANRVPAQEHAGKVLAGYVEAIKAACDTLR